MLAPDSNQKKDLRQFHKTISANSPEGNGSSSETFPAMSNTTEEPLINTVASKEKLQMTLKEYAVQKKKVADFDMQVFHMTSSFFNKAKFDDPIWQNVLHERLQRAESFLKNGNTFYKTTFKLADNIVIYFFVEYFRESELINYRINFFFEHNGKIEGQDTSADIDSATLLINNELYMEAAVRYTPLFDTSGVTTILLPLPDSQEESYVLLIKDQKVVRMKDQLIEWIPSNEKEEKSFYKYISKKYTSPMNQRRVMKWK